MDSTDKLFEPDVFKSVRVGTIAAQTQLVGRKIYPALRTASRVIRKTLTHPPPPPPPPPHTNHHPQHAQKIRDN